MKRTLRVPGLAFVLALILIACEPLAYNPTPVALVITNLALGILGKAVPQLNVLMLAFPITIGLGLLMFGAALPFLGSLFSEWVEAIPLALDTVIDGFAPTPSVR